jgi:hypothetical protein
VHDVGSVGFEVARGGLFDVFDALEALGRFFADLAEEAEQIVDVGAALVEVDAVAPVNVGAGFVGDAVDTDDAFDVPFQFVALELDFDVVEAVEADPFGEGFGQAVGDGFGDVGRGEGVGAADGVVEIDAGAGLAKDVGIEVLAAEVGAEEGVEGGAEQIGAVGLIAVAFVELSKGVVRVGAPG